MSSCSNGDCDLDAVGGRKEGLLELPNLRRAGKLVEIKERLGQAAEGRHVAKMDEPGRRTLQFTELRRELVRLRLPQPDLADLRTQVADAGAPAGPADGVSIDEKRTEIFIEPHQRHRQAGGQPRSR